MKNSKSLFLGNTIHAIRCEILNPWVLDFETNNVGFFKAHASDVLQIENYSLGYTLVLSDQKIFNWFEGIYDQRQCSV